MAPQAEASPAEAPPTSPSAQHNDITGYENAQDPFATAKLGTLREFMAEGEEASSLGMRLRETQRELENGEEADGLLVVSVVPGSPAAKAGLRSYSSAARDVMTGVVGVVMAATMLFPPAMPAMLMLPAVGSQVSDSYDMIIAVDGWPVTSFSDFVERMRNVRPGELVYLSVLRNGKHVQITVAVPSASTAGSY